MSHSDQLVTRSLAAVWHPCTQMKLHEWVPLVPIARGDGPWLTDFDGRHYLDAISSWWVNLFGHANPRIGAAVRDQLTKLEHVMLAGFTHEPVVELSERLARLVPGELGHCFYASDGSSAVEIALKMSVHYWANSGRPGKTDFVSLAGAYHGETQGALGVGDVALFKDAYAALLRSATRVPSPDWRQAAPGESAASWAVRCAQALEEYLTLHHPHIAALIVEPLVQCAGGMAMHHPSYLTYVRDICDRLQVHLIADEIAVGFGRTGTLFACEQAGVSPDILCLSKGLSGGYLPLSVVMSTDAVYQAFLDDDVARGFLHSHSYTGNPLACRAALATLDIFERDGVIAENRGKSALLSTLAEPIRTHPRVSDFRNTGMIWAFEVATADPHFARRWFQGALSEGLLLRPLGNTVYFMPPYVIREEEMHWLVRGTLNLLDTVA
ncbi:MAG TPA: adenosylmethionine--8-amino-7-oxononanoate transaminase [Burkholderiales bacterium]|nr:adenosylmethionine--8-amino-7-oxononanoate transaminase [Burkholderiales bacterium]